ncbi:MAG: putative integral rane protein [Actinomycetia bacterium]|nr:putative integral rane protein [Actinomycetes bacterium]
MPKTGGRSRRALIWVLRISVSAVLMAVLLANIHLDKALPKHRTVGTLLWLGAAVLVTWVGVVLSSWRWQLVLVAFDKRVRLRTLIRHTLAGLFVGNVLPSTIGGDVVKISRSAKDTGSASTAFASVVLERLTGFVTLPVLCFLGFLLHPALFGTKGSWVALLTSGVAVVVLGMIIVIAGHPRLAGRFAGRENRTQFIGAVHIGVAQLRRHPRQAIKILVVAFVFQVTSMLVFYCAVRALEAPVPFLTVLAMAPAVAMAQVLPLSLNGLGVREGMLVILLRGVNGVTHSQAIGIGILWLAATLIASLAGAIPFAVGHRRGDDDTSIVDTAFEEAVITEAAAP